jgi:hypothetical protein
MSNVFLDDLTEEVAFYVRQSRSIQMARVEAYLDGVVLAAEQVQDVRLTLLKEPPEVSGWNAAGAIFLTFVLESTVPGKVLSSLARLIFTPVLQMNVVFRALPKSPEGEALIDLAQRLSRIPPGRPQTGRSYIDTTGTGPFKSLTPARARRLEAQTFNEIVQSGISGRPGLGALGKESVVLYHAWLDAYVKGGSLEQDLSAITKAVVQNSSFALSRPIAAVPGTSPAVELRAAAYEYATLNKLGIQLQHDRLEALVRTSGFSPDGLAQVVKLCQWKELNVGQRADPIFSGLTAIRDRFALLFEAIIWARLERFVPERIGEGFSGVPTVTGDLDQYVGASGRIDKRLSDYWLDRFAAVVALRRGVTEEVWRKRDTGSRLFDLRDYFWAIVLEMPRLRA